MSRPLDDEDRLLLGYLVNSGENGLGHIEASGTDWVLWRTDDTGQRTRAPYVARAARLRSLERRGYVRCDTRRSGALYTTSKPYLVAYLTEEGRAAYETDCAHQERSSP
jgi:hypothetical protein